jgi:hypothetical protein
VGGDPLSRYHRSAFGSVSNLAENAVKGFIPRSGGGLGPAIGRASIRVRQSARIGPSPEGLTTFWFPPSITSLARRREGQQTR